MMSHENPDDLTEKMIDDSLLMFAGFASVPNECQIGEIISLVFFSHI